MRRIEESSQQISNIIGVIDEIAFQTNLLALNAGVEAARAGDAGKGFAVVAQEVRELAQRAAGAAKEIKGLIQNSSLHVESGVKLVRETGDALKTIGGFIIDMNTHMDSIATSAREQSTGLMEVNQPSTQWIRRPSRMPPWWSRQQQRPAHLPKKPQDCAILSPSSRSPSEPSGHKP